MIKVILVGDIGAGKTYVSKLFMTPCFSADTEVAKIYNNNRKCYIALKKKFPKFIKKFPVKKSELSNIIRNKISNLKEIGAIIHPFVRKELKKFLNKNKNKGIVVLDIPLFLENKMNKKNDIIIFLKTMKKEADKRLKNRKNFSKKLLKILRKSQLPLKQKRKKSKYILVNNYDAPIMKKKVKILKNKILNDRSRS